MVDLRKNRLLGRFPRLAVVLNHSFFGRMIRGSLEDRGLHLVVHHRSLCCYGDDVAARWQLCRFKSLNKSVAHLLLLRARKVQRCDCGTLHFVGARPFTHHLVDLTARVRPLIEEYWNLTCLDCVSSAR